MKILKPLRAQLAAAQAALEAAEKATAAQTMPAQAVPTQLPQENQNAPETQEALTSHSAPPSPPATLSDFARTMTQAYSFTDNAITIGTLVENNTPTQGVCARIPLNIFNRHLLVAGATGSGKTRTLQLLAEGLSRAGTSVLLIDVKGDLTGVAQNGTASDKLLARTQANGQEWVSASFPTELLTLGGIDTTTPGAIVRARISDFGPLLLAHALSLNTTQEQALHLIFHWADTHALELVDLSDLRAVISYFTSPEGKEELSTIGGVSKATAGVILRALTT